MSSSIGVSNIGTLVWGQKHALTWSLNVVPADLLCWLRALTSMVNNVEEIAKDKICQWEDTHGLVHSWTQSRLSYLHCAVSERFMWIVLEQCTSLACYQMSDWSRRRQLCLEWFLWDFHTDAIIRIINFDELVNHAKCAVSVVHECLIKFCHSDACIYNNALHM